jgi:hypothetical protein
MLFLLLDSAEMLGVEADSTFAKIGDHGQARKHREASIKAVFSH